MSVVWLFIAACASCGLGVNGESSILEDTPEVWEEVRVVLESAAYVKTIRQARVLAVYEFRVTERVNETFGFNPHESPPQPGEDPDVFTLRCYGGSDVDNEGLDSIDRVNLFFEASAPTQPHAILGKPMTISNTNAVTLRVFDDIWLFSDERGQKIVIDSAARSPEWRSRHIMDRLGGAEPAPLIYLSRRIQGQSLAVLLQHTDPEVRLAALRALPVEGKAAIEPLLQHFFRYADGVMDRAQIIGTRVDFVTTASHAHYKQAEVAVLSLVHYKEYADDIVPRLRPYQDAAKYSPQLASRVGHVLRVLAPPWLQNPKPKPDSSNQQ